MAGGSRMFYRQGIYVTNSLVHAYSLVLKIMLKRLVMLTTITKWQRWTFTGSKFLDAYKITDRYCDELRSPGVKGEELSYLSHLSLQNTMALI